MLSKLLRWIGVILASLIALIAIFAGFVYVRSESIVNKTYTAPEDKMTIPTDATAVERGRYLANYVSVCVECHGVNLEGGIVTDDPLLGRIVAPNLTKGNNGVGGQLSDVDFVRVLRYGILPDGKSAKVMPSDDYAYLSDADLGALIAYVKSVPPKIANCQPFDSDHWAVLCLAWANYRSSLRSAAILRSLARCRQLG